MHVFARADVASACYKLPSVRGHEEEKGQISGGGAWLVRFQGCNTAINKIRAFVFGRKRGSPLCSPAYFWTVDGAWNFYMFQEKPAAPVVYGVLSIAGGREREAEKERERERDSLLVGIAFTG